MTSQRKIAANRSNGRRGAGPRSTAGKARASRNAFRHGLAVINHIETAPSEEVKFLAFLICDENDEPPTLFAQAQVLARNEMALRAIREQQCAVIERVRDPSKVALAKRDYGRKLMMAQFARATLADKRITSQLPKLLNKYRDRLRPEDFNPKSHPGEHVPRGLKLLLEEPDPEERQRLYERARAEIEQAQRDDHAALKEAMPDLIRLERYQTRAWAQHVRAVRDFLNIRNSLT
jgi:hypothetical protein